ncbi:glycosyltransferase family 4 protein [Halomicrobium mukohataei]|nr:glycosyltransferase family 4 protein [Halomicrobium mukohataei]
MGDLTSHMAEECEVTVIAPPSCYPASDFDWSWDWETTEVRNGCEIVRLWAWQLRTVDPSFVDRLLYYFTFVAHALFWLFQRRQKYDVIITTSPPIFTGMVALPFSMLGSLNWILDIRDLWIDVSSDLGFISEDGIITKSSRRYQAATLRQADLITVTTHGTTTQLRERYDFETEISVIPNGVDTSVFTPEPSSNEVELIYTGNLGYGQDLETCIRALHYTESDVRFRIVGDGDLRPELVELAEKIGVSDQVDFMGLVPREQIPQLLGTAAIGVAPLKEQDSLEYAVPTKLYEYWACELPVLALGQGTIEEIVSESGAGVVPSGSPRTVAREIDALLSNKEHRKQLAERGRTFVVANYERQALAHEFVQLAHRVNSPSGEISTAQARTEEAP